MEIEELIEDLKLINIKANEYDDLDRKFKLICSKGLQETLHHITILGLNNTEITEQQALNKLAERFPMTINQIVSTLEMKVAHIEQEKVEVPQAEHATSEFPEHIIKYLDNCKARNAPIEVVLSDARYYNRDYAYWTEEEIRKIAVAYATGEYTVKKEPEWVVAIPGQEAFSGLIEFDKKRKGVSSTCGNQTSVKFTDKAKAEAVALLIGGEVVPVEEEAE